MTDNHRTDDEKNDAPKTPEADPNLLVVDMDHLTVGEIEEIEERAEMSIDAFGQPGIKKGKFLRALGYVTKRRTVPDFTWEDAANLRIEFNDEDMKAAGANIPPTGNDAS